MILDKYDDLRLILANMMRDDKQCNTLGKGSDNMEKYLQQIVKFFDISIVSVSLANQKAIEYAKLKHSDEYKDQAFERDVAETEIDFARGFIACSEYIKANEL